MRDFDLFFISYDEPMANVLWQQMLQKYPWAKRVHGVKGFDAAYKACAQQSSTDRFFTVDGDNEILPSFEEIKIDPQLTSERAVLSWGAKNSINGLCYGNGGIKSWNRSLTLEMSSHETDSQGKNVDFCFQVPYIQMPEVLSVARIHDSPYQAFRAGFREGIKLSLMKGERVFPEKSLKELLWWENYDRLKIWCSVGMDRESGVWAIYGARLGIKSLFLDRFDYPKIKDYDWFQLFWNESVWNRFADEYGAWDQKKLVEEVETIGREIQRALGLDICLLNAEASKFFRSVYINPARSGRLLL